jgi:DNA-nicking Smr family endonuclease
VMAGNDEDFEVRMQDAYASGDPEAILSLLGCAVTDHTGDGGAVCPVTTPDTYTASHTPSLNPSAVEFTPSTSRRTEAPGTTLGEPNKILDATRALEFDVEYDEEEGDGWALSTLCALYPKADRGVVAALLNVHNADLNSAASSLAELDSCGALDEGTGSTNLVEHDVSWDSEAYAVAVAQFDQQFPSLGEKSCSFVQKYETPYQDGKLLSTVRELRLAESVPWVSAERVSAALQRCEGDTAATEIMLLTSDPKPVGWEKGQAAKRREAERALAGLSSASLQGNDYGGDGERVGQARWVETGGAVRKLYMAKREEARDEARRRNKFFEQAAAAARAGKGAEASRLGSQGRAANAKMKRLHTEAADAIWSARNADPAKDGQLDLHGMHVAEAVERLPDALADIARFRAQVKVVTGTGHHTVGGGGNPRLRPAVCAILQEHGYAFREIIDSKSGHVGAFLVSLL